MGTPTISEQTKHRQCTPGRGDCYEANRAELEDRAFWGATLDRWSGRHPPTHTTQWSEGENQGGWGRACWVRTAKMMGVGGWHWSKLWMEGGNCGPGKGSNFHSPRAGSPDDAGSGVRLTSYGSCEPWHEAHLPAPAAEAAMRADLASTPHPTGAQPLTPSLPAAHAPAVSSSPEQPSYPP